MPNFKRKQCYKKDFGLGGMQTNLTHFCHPKKEINKAYSSKVTFNALTKSFFRNKNMSTIT